MPFFPTRLIQLRDIQGIGTGKTAIINCPIGPRYRRIILTLGDAGAGNANAPAVTGVISGDLKVVLGTKEIRRLTGTQLDLINTSNGAQYGSLGVAGGGGNGSGRTYLPIFFEEPWRKRADFQNGLAVETGWLDQNGVFQIKVPLTGTTPVLGALAIVDDFNSGKPNPVMKYYSDDSNTAAAALDLANLFQGNPPSDLVSTISFLDTSDAKTVTVVRLTLNGEIVLDDLTFDQQTDLLKGSDMNPAAGAFHVVFDHDDLFESLRQVGAISASQATLTFSAASAGTIRRVMQRVGDPTL